MIVPAYCRTLNGRVFRLVRTSEMVAPDRVRYVLRAESITTSEGSNNWELAREVDAELIRDKIANNQAIPTPESTYEALWSQLRVEIDARDAG